MAASFKLVTKGSNGKSITKEIDAWALEQFKAASQITTDTAIEITEVMIKDKKAVYFHDGNTLIKVTFKARKGPAKKSATEPVTEYDAFQAAIDEIEETEVLPRKAITGTVKIVKQGKTKED